MAEMTEAELSLAVARIMYPEYEWKMPHKSGDCIVSGRAKGGIMRKSFDYQSKICAFDMAVWLAMQQRIVNEKHDGGADCMLKFQGLSLNVQAALGLMLSLHDAPKLLATAILELGGEKL